MMENIIGNIIVIIVIAIIIVSSLLGANFIASAIRKKICYLPQSKTIRLLKSIGFIAILYILAIPVVGFSRY